MQPIEGVPQRFENRAAAVFRRVAGMVPASVLAAFAIVMLYWEVPHSVSVLAAVEGKPAAKKTPTPATPPPKTGWSPIKAPINPTGFTSARVCGTCHVDIYNSWKNSLHAFSLSDPVFDTAYMQALKEGGEEARRLCLRCHAPLTLVNGDWELREGVTREGVTCDFCHSVTAVHLDQPKTPYSLEPGLVKRSVLRKASSPVHEVAYSKLHETAEFCGACHNYVLADGTAIMSTYKEWRDGPYAADGVQCQDCHMVRSAGQVVSEEVRRPSSSGVHLHDLIHDTDQLRSAVGVEVVRAKRTGTDLSVEVAVTNEGSGHMIPTGIPSRELVLTVTATTSSHVLTQQRRFRKVLADKDGRVLTRDFEMLLRATSVVADNRIGPRERRVERFGFAVPATGTVKVTATVSYVYSPLVIDQREINIELARAEKFTR